MRTLLFLVALLAGGYAGYVEFFEKKGPYGSYSKAQLEQLEHEHLTRFLASESEESRIALELIREEQKRPLRTQAALGLAGISLGIAIVLTLAGLVRGRGRHTSSGDEEGSSQEAGGRFAPSKLTRDQAAALLGVRPDAPRTVVEAALQAQLAERDPSLLHGLGPDLRQKVLQQREELIQAGNVLLGRQEIPFSTDSSQG